MFSVRKNICVLSLAAAVMFTFPAAARPAPSGIVIDARTGEVLVSKNPNAVHHPASLTKLMTLYITFEALEKGLIKMDDELPVSAAAAQCDGRKFPRTVKRHMRKPAAKSKWKPRLTP